MTNNLGTRVILTSIVIFGTLGIAGCVTPIHQTDNFDPKAGVQTLAIDAKQRVVIFVTRPADPDPNGSPSQNGQNSERTVTVTCAEPSPDALSALSSSIGGGLQNNSGVVANIASAMTESAASIGLRTQSIQLLRDGMYRSCEAYAAQAITKEEYNRQQRRYQNLMLSLLAIEQISGAVVAHQVGFGNGSSSASVGEGANDAAAAVTQADKAANDAQTALDTATNTLTSDQKACSSDPTNSSCTNVAKEQADVTDKQTALDNAKKNQVTAKEALQAARAAVKAAATGATVNYGDTIKTNQLTDASAKYVAEAARTIVSTTLLASFAQEECSRLWDIVETPNIPKATENADQAGLISSLREKGVTDAEIAKISKYAEVASDKQHAKTAALQERLRFLGVPEADIPDRVNEIVGKLVASCYENQKALLNEKVLFTPQYGTANPPALAVLGGDSAISIAPGDPAIDLIIVGGIPPYTASATAAFNVTKELEATIPPPKGMAYTLHIERPDGASQAGATTIFVVDSTNSHFDIHIMLTKKAAAVPASAPAHATKPAAPTGVKATSAAGSIKVTFSAPKDSGSPITGYTATATNTDAIKKEKPLTAKSNGTEPSVSIPKCTVGGNYTVTVVANHEGEDSDPSKASNSAKCSK